MAITVFRVALSRALIVAAVALLACVSAPTSADAATPLPQQGVYEQCAIAATPARCAARLQRLSAAGFRVVINGSSINGRTSPADIAAYAAAANAVNLKLIWPLHGAGYQSSLLSGSDLLRALPLLALRCGCIGNRGLLAHIVGTLRRFPATWGYYLADEPQRDEAVMLSTLAQVTATLDPEHKRLIMGCGICAGDRADLSWLGAMNAALGTDSYPVFYQPPNQPEVADRVGQAVAALERVAGQAGRETVVALQAWNWGDSQIDSRVAGLPPTLTRFPTRREIEMQRNAAIANGRPSLILWFMLPQVIGWETGQRPSNWAQPTDTAARWANLVGGAFAPLPNDPPTARLDLKGRRAGGRLRLVLNGRRSRDRDGRVASWRWRASGRKGVICRASRCVVRIPRRSRLTVRLAITDDRGTRVLRRRRVRVPRAARWRLPDGREGRPRNAATQPGNAVTRPFGNSIPMD